MSVAYQERYEQDRQDYPELPPLHEAFYDYVEPTPLGDADVAGHGNVLVGKMESLQPAGAFKERGVTQALLNRPARSYVTASAGSHGCALARMAARLERHATIYVPDNTPASKRDRIQEFGGEYVTLVVGGASFDEAREQAEQHRAVGGCEFVSPYNDLNVIRGQQTVAEEILQQAPHTDRIFVPVGGGGLLAGTLLATEKHPGVTVVAVQFEGNTSAERSLQAGRPVTADAVSPLCEGSAVRQIGDVPFAIMNAHADRLEFVTVSAAEVGETLQRSIYARGKLESVYGKDAWTGFPETTGALAEAGARAYARQHSEHANETWVHVVTGGNTDPTREQAALDAYRDQCRTLHRWGNRVLVGAQVKMN